MRMHGTERVLRIVLATAIVGGPLGYLVGGLLAPAVHTSGTATPGCWISSPMTRS